MSRGIGPVVAEVRVRLRFSGISPGDTKKRRGWQGSAMPYPRVVPHRDGAGVIDAVGGDVDASPVGQRVWVFGAQSYRRFGTAAEHTVVPSMNAIDLPDDVSGEVGACLGIPGITAHRAVFGDGPVAGQTVVVHGVLGGVDRLAAQLAVRAKPASDPQTHTDVGEQVDRDAAEVDKQLEWRGERARADRGRQQPRPPGADHAGAGGP